MVNLYKKLHKTTNVLKYFTSHSWEWTHNNNDMVVNCLNAEDRKVCASILLCDGVCCHCHIYFTV